MMHFISVRKLIFLVFFSATMKIFFSLASAAEIFDDFDDRQLDLCVWDPVQFDYPRLIGFEEAENRSFLINTVDEKRENDRFPGQHPCRGILSDSAVEADNIDLTDEELGPSLIEPSDIESFGLDEEKAKCAKAEIRDGKKVIQRNELRFRNKKAHRHPIDKPHWYQVIARAEGDIPNCGSVRWVTAQWKYDDAKWPDASPFLAQRFDNGILHLTVQNENCRCMIAKASGDPDYKVLGDADLVAAASPNEHDLVDIDPLKCIWTGGGDKEGKVCKPDQNFRLQALTGPTPPLLPNPQADWVEMSYLVKASNDEHGIIEVYANGQFIVRATGLIGYRGGQPSNTKFKFGHYRDKIPGSARLLYDRICMSEVAAVCNPELKLMQ